MTKNGVPWPQSPYRCQSSFVCSHLMKCVWELATFSAGKVAGRLVERTGAGVRPCARSRSPNLDRSARSSRRQAQTRRRKPAVQLLAEATTGLAGRPTGSGRERPAKARGHRRPAMFLREPEQQPGKDGFRRRPCVAGRPDGERPRNANRPHAMAVAGADADLEQVEAAEGRGMRQDASAGANAGSRRLRRRGP